ncbi:putative trafficking protein particle complex subunit 2 [Helianthus annuus]|nr:putative trafficking protein particle complex subunit 2 [Helianthus annuus]
MASTACFMIISKMTFLYMRLSWDCSEKRRSCASASVILHAALDVVQDLAWTTSAMFNDWWCLYSSESSLPTRIRVTSSHFDTKVRALARRYL